MNLSDINQKPLLIAVTMAREAFNSSLPDVKDEGGNSIDPKPGSFATDEEYFDARILGMVESWAKQHGTDVVEIDAKISELQAKRAEIVAKDK